jgi:signal transduction histidine kinase
MTTSHSLTQDSLAGGSDHAAAFLAHEVRNLLNVAILSFEVLKISGAGVAGDKGQVLCRSLNDLRTLINRTLLDTRTAHGRDSLGRVVIDIADFVNEIEAAATLEARAKGIRFVVPPVPEGLFVDADRHELGAAVRNLVQNAVKFTRPGTTVDLRVLSSGDRVRMEVQDECGGLASENQDDLFRPFEQRGQDRSGLGLGLAFSRRVVEACGGSIAVRNLAGHGCVFAIDLPRAVRPAAYPARDSEPAASRGHGAVCNATQAGGDRRAMVVS